MGGDYDYKKHVGEYSKMADTGDFQTNLFLSRRFQKGFQKMTLIESRRAGKTLFQLFREFSFRDPDQLGLKIVMRRRGCRAVCIYKGNDCDRAMLMLERLAKGETE